MEVEHSGSLFTVAVGDGALRVFPGHEAASHAWREGRAPDNRGPPIGEIYSAGAQAAGVHGTYDAGPFGEKLG